MSDPSRYLLIVASACPFCRRTLLARALLGIANVEVSVVSPVKEDGKWVFSSEFDGSTGPCSLFPEAKSVADVYAKTSPPNWDQRFSLPLLLDKSSKKSVSNSSAEICDFFRNTLAGSSTPVRIGDCAAEAADEIISKCGILVSAAGKMRSVECQDDWDRISKSVDEALEFLERNLDGNAFLLGQELTRADVLVWPMLVQWEGYSRRVCDYQRSIFGGDFPLLVSYMKRVTELIQDAKLRKSIYKQEHFDIDISSTKKLKFIARQPPLPIFEN